jgi:hypothetical protein
MRVSRKQLLELLEIERDLKEEQQRSTVHSGFEYKAVDIIIAKEDCKWDLVEMEWVSFLNWWTRADVEKNRKGYKDEKTGKYKPPVTTLNARGEEMLLPGKMYRDAALNRICLFRRLTFMNGAIFFLLAREGNH